MTLQVHGPRCPFCHEPVVPTDAKAACDRCMSWHHDACWSEHGRCAACGATAALEREADDEPRESAELQVPATLGAEDLAQWLLERCGADEHLLVRAVLAAAQRAVPPDAPERGVLALFMGAYLACPCRVHALEAQDASRTAAEMARASLAEVTGAPGDPAVIAAKAATAVQAALRTPGREVRRYGPGPFVSALEAAAAALAARRGSRRAGPEDRQAIREAIEAALDR